VEDVSSIAGAIKGKWVQIPRGPAAVIEESFTKPLGIVGSGTVPVLAWEG
jgi:hypothetical protein